MKVCVLSVQSIRRTATVRRLPGRHVGGQGRAPNRRAMRVSLAERDYNGEARERHA